jgi:hypothetical protein
MTNVTVMDIKDYDGSIMEFVQIANEDGSITSMPKSEYDHRQAQQSTLIVIDETKTK